MTTKPPTTTEESAASQGSESDALIGRAFWWSIGVILAAGLAAAGVYLAITYRPVLPLEPPAQLPAAKSSRPQPIAIPSVRFVEVTAEAGITFVHQPGSLGDVLFPEVMGGGVALLDYNSDGRLDVLFVNGTLWPDTPGAQRRDQLPTPALYRNEGDLRFTDVSREAGLDFSYYGMGVAVGDFDNDGDPDLYLTAVGSCRLLRNDGGVFRDVTQAAGVAGDRDAWSTSAGWFDYDLDGDLDLFVCNYVRWSRRMNFDRLFRPQGGVRGTLSPQSFDGSLLKLYRNEGEGLFSDVSQEAGIEVFNDDTGAPVAKALGVCFTDLNDDAWPDIVVANDTVRNFAYVNQQDGKFRERGRELGVAYGPYGESRQGMGIDIADFRNNGTQGIAIGNFAGEMTALFVSSKGAAGNFSDEALAAGVGADTRSTLTFGLFFFDYDLDGRLDLLEANGHVAPYIAKVVTGQTYEQPAQLFWNCGAKAEIDFVKVTPREAGEDLFQPLVGRGAAFGDLDGDGDLDVVLTGIGARPRVLRNDQELGHHWVRLKLVGRRSNRDAIGARVELKTQGTWRRQTVSPTKSYLAQCETTVTFGLGPAAEVEEVRVVWPGGRIQPIDRLRANQLTIIEEDAGN